MIILKKKKKKNGDYHDNQNLSQNQNVILTKIKMKPNE